MSIAIIGDDEAVLGFRLAGLTKAYVYDEKMLKEMLESCIDSKILIVTEDVAENVKSEEWFTGKFKGVIVEIPTKKGSTGSAMREISRLFENAIGVKIKD